MIEQMMLTLFLTSILLLTSPLLMKTHQTPTSAVKTAFLVSLPTTMMMTKYHTHNMSADLNPIMTDMMPMTLTVTANKYSMLFLPMALLVTWSILEFSTWYITPEHLSKKFQAYLLTFLTFMVVLATAGSLMQLLIGWEGVGIMSFMLINWWSARANATTAAIQAIIYNRIGDIGLVLAMAIIVTDLGTWDTGLTTSLHTKNTITAFGLILAATGKSAQFLMHMWLPAAMEGPTPVSSLLHSSTMVVAGIYMLAQMHPIMNTNLTSSTCLLLGTMTSVYAALCAIVQNDIKKIIAFSTSSQLGLMMIAIGINKPDLAIFHMITHATFKSTLFLTAGSIIHNMHNDQDIRKTNCTETTMPITTNLMTINGLALSGVPFLSGFYSKDAIIETMLTSNINTWAMTATLIATTMTSAYTLRMLFYITKKNYNHKPIMMQQEATKAQMLPLLRLSTMAIILGTILYQTMYFTPPTINKPMKMITMAAIIIGMFLSVELSNKPPLGSDKVWWKFISHLAFFKVLHRKLPLVTLMFSQNKSTQLSDSIWLESIGPKTADLINAIITNTVSTQSGHIKKYLLIMLITTTLALLSQMI